MLVYRGQRLPGQKVGSDWATWQEEPHPWHPVIITIGCSSIFRAHRSFTWSIYVAHRNYSSTLTSTVDRTVDFTMMIIRPHMTQSDMPFYDWIGYRAEQANGTPQYIIWSHHQHKEWQPWKSDPTTGRLVKDYDLTDGPCYVKDSQYRKINPIWSIQLSSSSLHLQSCSTVD